MAYLGRRYEHLVHRSDRREELRNDLVHGAAPLGDVSLHPPDESNVWLLPVADAKKKRKEKRNGRKISTK